MSEQRAQLSSAVAIEISKDYVMVMTSVWLHDKSSCKLLGQSMRNGLM